MNYPIRYKSLTVQHNSSETVYPLNDFLPSDAEELLAINVKSSKYVRVAINCEGGHNILNMDFLPNQMGDNALSLLDISHKIDARLPITGYVKIQDTPSISDTIITFKYKAKP